MFKNNSMLKDTTGASVMQKLVMLPGQKLAWISSSKRESELDQISEATVGLFGPGGSKERVTMNPIVDTRGFSDLSLTAFPLYAGMEQEFTKDKHNWKLMKSKTARTSSNSKSVACGDESFKKDFQSKLHESSQTIQFYNLRSATNQDPTILYDDVISNIVACRVTDYRKPLMRGQVYECSVTCNKFIRLTLQENFQWYRVRNGSHNIRGITHFKFTCHHVGRKCSK